jgi:hypothetical protein
MCAQHPEIGASFTCTRCGSFGCPGCVFSALADQEICQACAAQGLGEPIPWERRRELGTWKAFWRTTRLASRRPREFFRTPATTRGAILPVLYGVAVYAFGQYLYMAILVLAMIAGGIVMAAGTGEPVLGFAIGGYSLFLGLMMLVQAPVYGFMGILVGGGLTHVTLVLMKKANASFEQTLRAVSYANAPYFFYFIPCLGPLLAWFWMLRTETVAIRETHRVGTDRALVAVLGYRLLLILLVGGLYALLVAATFAFESQRY